MTTSRYKTHFMLSICACLAFAGCVPSSNAAESNIQLESLSPLPPVITVTPTQCTGWNCTLRGIVFQGATDAKIEMEGIKVKFLQTSWCSPTKGEQETISAQDGSFSFDVYLHDTDSFLITIDQEGFQPAKIKFGGFDCLYCVCPSLEIILLPE